MTRCRLRIVQSIDGVVQVSEEEAVSETLAAACATGHARRGAVVWLYHHDPGEEPREIGMFVGERFLTAGLRPPGGPARRASR